MSLNYFQDRFPIDTIQIVCNKKYAQITFLQMKSRGLFGGLFCFLPSIVQWPQADVVDCHSIYHPQCFSKTAFSSVQLFSQRQSP